MIKVKEFSIDIDKLRLYKTIKKKRMFVMEFKDRKSLVKALARQLILSKDSDRTLSLWEYEELYSKNINTINKSIDTYKEDK